jgi:hypothetical protein
MHSQTVGHKANLKQYRAINGKWQFVPVVKADGKPKPQLVLIDVTCSPKSLPLKTRILS